MYLVVHVHEEVLQGMLVEGGPSARCVGDVGVNDTWHV